MVVIAAGIMFSINVKMSLISMALLPVLFGVSFVYFKGVKKQFTLSDEAEGVIPPIPPVLPTFCSTWSAQKSTTWLLKAAPKPTGTT